MQRLLRRSRRRDDNSFRGFEENKKKRNSKSFSIVRQINTNVYSRRPEIEVTANRGYIVIPYNESVFFFFFLTVYCSRFLFSFANDVGDLQKYYRFRDKKKTRLKITMCAAY